MRVLFILKQRDSDWGDYSASQASSGLANSAAFICDAIGDEGVAAKLVHVVDNNDIDREVAAFHPTHVIIEAYWVVPEKFAVLRRLHPSVIWIVRNHSELAFLANEGMAIDWTVQYAHQDNVYVSGNSTRCNEDFKVFVPPEKVVFLPNFYPIPEPRRTELWDFSFSLRPRALSEIHIFCPGAVRTLKNHLAQAVAALKTAQQLRVHLHFWINGTRIEAGGDQVVKNVRALFAGRADATLHELPWQTHQEFLETIRTMDAVMQVSFSETFNIVGADAVLSGVALVGSPELAWSDDRLWADPTDVNDMAHKLELAICHPKPNHARKLLWEKIHNVPKQWVERLSSLS